MAIKLHRFVAPLVQPALREAPPAQSAPVAPAPSKARSPVDSMGARRSADGRHRPNLDGAARALAPEALRSHRVAPPGVDPAKLFSPEARQRDLGELQRTVGAEFGLSFVEMDVNDPRSVSTVTERFARAHVNGDALAGTTYARGVAKTPLLAGADMTPAAAFAATGFDPDTGAKERFALVAFNGKNNHVMKGAFGDLRGVFGADELKQTERMTLLHEAGHVVVHHAEHAGTEAWGQSVAALDAPSGQAGDAIRRWAASAEGGISHPDVKRLMLGEAEKLDHLQARTRAGETNLSYDAEAVQTAYQAIKARPDYRNFQENMGDGFMAMKLKQEGVDVTRVVGAARAKEDPEHDTQRGLSAVGEVKTSALLGLSSRQLMVRTAQVVQGALGLR